MSIFSILFSISFDFFHSNVQLFVSSFILLFCVVFCGASLLIYEGFFVCFSNRNRKCDLFFPIVCHRRKELLCTDYFLMVLAGTVN